MDKQTRDDIRTIEAIQDAQRRNQIAELTVKVEELEQRVEDQNHTHTLVVSEKELSSVVAKQVREALPSFIDGFRRRNAIQNYRGE